MGMRFKRLQNSDFDLLPSWVQEDKAFSNSNKESSPHKKESLLSHHKRKKVAPIKKYSFVIYVNKSAIGYIQYYSAYSCPEKLHNLDNLPKSLARIEMIMVDNSDNNMKQHVLELFLKSLDMF